MKFKTWSGIVITPVRQIPIANGRVAVECYTNIRSQLWVESDRPLDGIPIEDFSGEGDECQNR